MVRTRAPLCCLAAHRLMVINATLEIPIRSSTPNTSLARQDNDRPSDRLARELQAAGYQLGVLNAGVLGDAAGPNTENAPDNPDIQDGIDRLNR